MSFMFNPYPYEDMNPINRPELSDDTVKSIVSGTKEAAEYLGHVFKNKLDQDRSSTCIVAMDGYISAQWEQIINLMAANLNLQGIELSAVDFSTIYKNSKELDKQFEENLPLDREKDPVLLYGRLFKGGFKDLLDSDSLAELRQSLEREQNGSTKDKKLIVVYGCGAAVKELRDLYDSILYFDVTPKQTILRVKDGLVRNIGDETARPFKTLLRRSYYIDFEAAGHLRWELINENAIDYYLASDDPDNVKLIPQKSLDEIMASLVHYPMRCKPVYLEGIWGGHYVKRVRNLPDSMRNCAWVFDLIPLEVSILVEAGEELLEFPFFTFVQKEGKELMGEECVKKFGGYFPIRFNYDDSYHSAGNMSIQVHSGHDYNIENYGEHGRQDESYYIVATGHNARTYLGFKENADPDEFLELARKSEKDQSAIDYQKYINSVESKPGKQVMIPAGTIHSSGRNQVVLEIGSLTIGSYTYKLYDYLRKDFDGKPRPIHSYHGERVLETERNTSWVEENIVQEPGPVDSGDGWAEYIVGEHDLLYFSLRRLEFEKRIEGDTKGKFHVLTLVDGEKVRIRSKENPELCYNQNFLDVVIVPANMGKYVVENMGEQPVCIHKTILRDGFYEEQC